MLSSTSSTRMVRTAVLVLFSALTTQHAGTFINAFAPTPIGVTSRRTATAQAATLRLHQSNSSRSKSKTKTPLRYLSASPNGVDTTDTDTSSSSLNIELDRLLAVSSSQPASGSSSSSKGVVGQPSNLRQALTFLKQQESTNSIKLSKSNWDGIFTAIEDVTAAADESTEQAASSSTTDLSFPLVGTARQEMTDMYQLLQRQGELQLFGAISTQEPPAAGSTDVSPQLLEQILDLPMSALTPAPTNSLLIAGGVVAVLEGILAAATGISINALVLTTLAFAVGDRLFLNSAIFESFLKIFSPGIQDKILRHEAGHFLAAYLLGCPVEGIVLSAWAALQDRRFGARQVSAGTSFFDPILSQQINTSSQVTRSSVDRYSIIVMAGIAAEADIYGLADGGAGDEMALVAFLTRLNGGNNSNAAWNSDKIRNQARWGALQAVLMMRQYKPAYEAVVDALERGGRLGDCIYAIERAAREHNLPSLADRKPEGYINVDGGGVASWSTTKLEAQPLVQSSSTTKQKVVLNEEDALQTLQDYRTEVEQKLKDVEEKLKGLQ